MTASTLPPAHRPSAREAMLDAAEAHLGADGTLTLDSAARAAGVTKPGLMYHFATKEQLLSAVLERIAARYEVEMIARVRAGCATHENADHGAAPESLPAGRDGAPGEFAGASPRRRHLAYLDWAIRAPLSPADLVIFADPRLRVQLTAMWKEQLDRWLVLPAETPAAQQERLLAVRLMADGIWFDRASGLLEIPAARGRALQAIAAEILAGES